MRIVHMIGWFQKCFRHQDQSLTRHMDRERHTCNEKIYDTKTDGYGNVIYNILSMIRKISCLTIFVHESLIELTFMRHAEHE